MDPYSKIQQLFFLFIELLLCKSTYIEKFLKLLYLIYRIRSDCRIGL